MGGGDKRQQSNESMGGLGSLEDFLNTGSKKSSSELDDILSMAKKYLN